MLIHRWLQMGTSGADMPARTQAMYCKSELLGDFIGIRSERSGKRDVVAFHHIAGTRFRNHEFYNAIAHQPPCCHASV